ncbi:MAG TPA: single-stranded DNA-binding protein [Pirellulales bacterium]|jgi:single-strand DNA-binding protein
MASFNRVILVGNLTRDPELKYTPSNTAVTEIGLAVNDRRKSASGEWIEETTFVDVTLWGRTAEVASEYLTKGASILIEGRLKLDSWENKEGQKRTKLRVVGEKMQMLSGKGGGGGGGGAPRAPAARGRGGSGGGGGGSNYDDADFGPPADVYSSSEEPSRGAPPEDDIPF